MRKAKRGLVYQKRDVQLRRSDGFTMVEIAVMILIISVIAGMAMTRYTKVLERQYALHARNNLALVHAVAQNYFSRYGTFATSPAGGSSLAELNAVFAIAIPDSGHIDYIFTSDSGGFYAEAVRMVPFSSDTSFHWQLIVSASSTIDSGNPVCAVGVNCP